MNPSREVAAQFFCKIRWGEEVRRNGGKDHHATPQLRGLLVNVVSAGFLSGSLGGLEVFCEIQRAL